MFHQGANEARKTQNSLAEGSAKAHGSAGLWGGREALAGGDTSAKRQGISWRIALSLSFILRYVQEKFRLETEW